MSFYFEIVLFSSGEPYFFKKNRYCSFKRANFVSISKQDLPLHIRATELGDYTISAAIGCEMCLRGVYACPVQ